jgi:hypothetical protein
MTLRLLAGIGQGNGEIGVGYDEDGPAFQAEGGVRLFFDQSKRAAVRIELSLLRENTFDESSTHTRPTVGFTWRLGSAN